jgi:Lipase (class 3)
VGSSFAFNLLTEAASNTTTSLPAGFNAYIGWLLGQCCNVTYQDYDQNTGPDLNTLSFGSAGGAITASLIQGFTASEANGPGSTPLADPGDYSTFPAGFAAVLSIQNAPSGVPAELIVVALRGTQTWDEWFQNAEAYPDIFASGTSKFQSEALVHTGFYSLYTLGLLGATVSAPLDPSASNRATGSIAQQVATYFANTALPTNLPVYVTGHSLGGALAAYCAWDIQAILTPPISGINMYSLAAPRCALGFLVDTFGFPVDSFLQGYQNAIPNSFRVVHTCDLIPVLPPSTIVQTKYVVLTTAHVTDAWSYLGQSGNLTNNVVAFAAQTGDIGGNHSCTLTYVPYLAALAGGFSTTPIGRVKP